MRITFAPRDTPFNIPFYHSAPLPLMLTGKAESAQVCNVSILVCSSVTVLSHAVVQLIWATLVKSPSLICSPLCSAPIRWEYSFARVFIFLNIVTSVPSPNQCCPGNSRGAPAHQSSRADLPHLRLINPSAHKQRGAPTHWGGSTSLLRPAICGPPGAFSGLFGPVLPWLGVQTPPLSPSHWTIPSRSTLAIGRRAHGGPGSGACRHRPTLPRTHRQAVRMRNPATVAELVEAVELADAAQHRDAGERALPFPRKLVQEQRAPEGTRRPVERPTAPTPRDEPMPTEGLTPPGRTWLAGCIVHRDLPVGAPGAEIKINGRPFPTLLDSGSAVSLIQSCVLAPCGETKASLPIVCVHGETRHVPVRRVTISAAPAAWPVEVGVLKDLPVPVLLGRDWPGFDRLRVVEGKETQPGPDPLPHFIIRNGLLYCVVQRRGRKRPYWWCHGRRRKRCWSWPTRTCLPAIWERPTPPNGSVTASTGLEWRLKLRVFVSPAQPARKHLRERLPPAHWFRCLSSRCPSSASWSNMLRRWGNGSTGSYH